MSEAPKKKKKQGRAGTSPLKEGWAALVLVIKSISSPDYPTRRMTVFFYLAVAGIVVSAALGVYRWKFLRSDPPLSEKDKVALQLAKMLKAHTEEAKKKQATTNLGIFTVEVKRGNASAGQAELEIVAECNSTDTCEFVEGNLTRARDEISSVLVALDREEILSREGKIKIQRLIIERLNKLLPRGKVINLYFSRFIVT